MGAGAVTSITPGVLTWHELTAEYFTIHPKTVRPLSEMGESELVKLQAKADETDDEEVEKMEIADIG